MLCFFCLFLLIFFPRGKGYFNLLVGWVRDSSCAGQRMACISILEACISFRGAWKGLCVSKKSFIIVYIPNIFYHFFVIFT